MTLHFAIESDNGIWTEAVPVCGHNFSRRKKLTDDPGEVTCRECRKLCGLDAREENRCKCDEQLTECRGDPLLKRRAA